jgi:7-carboxy-7-deazaguanine synthase
MSTQTNTETNPLIEQGLSLPLMEDFYTIQGEGAQSGRAAYFVRLGGCDVGCVWCDVKESWDMNAHPLVAIEDIVNKVKVTNTNFAVITGGEPAMYNLEPLTTMLQQNGIETAIETSGAYPVTGTWHWICFSPKKFKQPVADVYPKAHELKVVIFNKHDFKWAEEHAAKVNKNCKLYLQPEWDKSDEMLPLIIDYVKEHPKWNISLQTHKYMNIP